MLHRVRTVDQQGLTFNDESSLTARDVTLYIEQHDRTLPLFQQALAIRLETLGERHPKTQDVMQSIAIVSQKLADPATPSEDPTT